MPGGASGEVENRARQSASALVSAGLGGDNTGSQVVADQRTRPSEPSPHGDTPIRSGQVSPLLVEMVTNVHAALCLGNRLKAVTFIVRAIEWQVVVGREPDASSANAPSPLHAARQQGGTDATAHGGSPHGELIEIRLAVDEVERREAEREARVGDSQKGVAEFGGSLPTCDLGTSKSMICRQIDV